MHKPPEDRYDIKADRESEDALIDLIFIRMIDALDGAIDSRYTLSRGANGNQEAR